MTSGINGVLEFRRPFVLILDFQVWDFFNFGLFKILDLILILAPGMLGYLQIFGKSVSEKTVQKDAPCPISPLRVRIVGVWVPGASFDPVFGVFRFRKNPFWR